MTGHEDCRAMIDEAVWFGILAGFCLHGIVRIAAQAWRSGRVDVREAPDAPQDAIATDDEQKELVCKTCGGVHAQVLPGGALQKLPDCKPAPAAPRGEGE